MQLILISGLSGSGKSIVLNTLEDLGYYCVDNLPMPLLQQLVEQLTQDGVSRAAVAMDMRGGKDVAALLPGQLTTLQAGRQIDVRFIFLDARDDVLIQRFSETRRRHPLARGNTTLGEAISCERDALSGISPLGHHIDTSDLRPNALRAFVRDFVQLDGGGTLTLMFESFGFKYGLPMDADLVFDVRCLPNPHYDPLLRPQTGLDREVIVFLDADADVQRMVADVGDFIGKWLPAYVKDNRSYLTVAIGCTGGQHRSVYIAERLASRFREETTVLVRHRSLAPV